MQNLLNPFSGGGAWWTFILLIIEKLIKKFSFLLYTLQTSNNLIIDGICIWVGVTVHSLELRQGV